MKNSKIHRKSDSLLDPLRRRPRLGKFIVLAVLLHVVFAIVFLVYKQKEPVEEQGVRVRPDTAVPKVLDRDSSFYAKLQSPMPMLKESRPMSPSKPIGLEEELPAAPLSRRPALQPRPLPFPDWNLKDSLDEPLMAFHRDRERDAEPVVEERRAQAASRIVTPGKVETPLSRRIGLSPPRMPALSALVLPQPRAIPIEHPERRAEVSAENRIDQADVRLARFSELHPAALPLGRPLREPKALSLSVWEPSVRPAAFTVPLLGHGTWKGQRMEASGAALALPKPLESSLHVRRPLLQSHKGVLESNIWEEDISGPEFGEPIRDGTFERTVQLASKIVSQEKPKALLPSLKRDLWRPKSSDLLERLSKPEEIKDFISGLVNRLLQDTPGMDAKAKIRVLAKNLTYRDLGVESEGTKLFSGLVRTEIKTLDQVELLSPSDVSKTPEALLEGEIWDSSREIGVRLRLLESRTGRELNSAESKIAVERLPEKVTFKPPEGKSLDVIPRVVALMNRFFPRGGSFQLGVWPDKGLDAVYLEGEKLMVYVLSEKDAYLRVDYYQVDGRVVHLLPNPLENNAVLRGRPLIIGKSAKGYEYTIEAPFGEELLMVIASKEPIKAETQSMIEPASPYIDRLAKSLQKQKAKGKLAGAHVIILTKGREPNDTGQRNP